MINQIGSFGYGVFCYAVDMLLMVLAFRRIEPPEAPWRKRVAATLMLLTLLPLYVLPVLTPTADSLTKIFTMQAMRSLIRFSLCIAYLSLSKQIPFGRAFYFSGIYLVIYNAYRLIASPAGLGSIVWKAVEQIPVPLIGTLIGEMFEYAVAWVLILWVRKTIFCKERGGSHAQRILTITYILCVTFWIRTSLSFISGELPDGLILSLVLALIPVLLVIIVIFMEYNISTHAELEAEQMQRITEAYRLKNIEVQQTRDDNMRILLHDTKNHLLAIGQMAESLGADKIQNYVNSLVSAYGLNQNCVDTGNEMINGLLSIKMEEVEASHVRFSVVMDARPLNRFPDVDLNTIFGNALDNAIEGCLTVADAEKRFVDIRGGIVANQMIITITNSFQGNIRMYDGLPVSTKKAGSLHGIGLKSLKRAVAKHNGMVDFFTEVEKFSVTIMLPLTTLI